MRRTEFIDIEHRGFELSDMALVNDSLLAACVADECVADAWDDEAFDGMGFEEAQNSMSCLWERERHASLAHLNRRLWALNTERTLS